MNLYLRSLALVLLFAASLCAQSQELRTFSNADGKTLKDRIIKFDFEKQEVNLETNGRIPLKTFSAADQAYILQWNQVDGFKSTMRFKTDISKKSWARMKYEQTVTPFFMDAVRLPGKTTPAHMFVPDENFEEYTAVYLEAEGYEILLRNQNFFPIENIVVESKVFYEQEYYVTPDEMFNSLNNEYNDTIVSNKVRFLSETIPVIIPREEVILYSECATIMDQQVDRTAITTTSENGDGDDSEDDTGDTMEGFGDWDDHGRRRKGKVIGVWVRMGIKGPDGQMVWREATEPTSLPDKVSWDPAPVEPEKEDRVIE